MIVQYSPLPDITSKVVLAPLVPIILRNDTYEFATFALIDSGASGAVIYTVIADALSIKWDKLPAEGGFSVGGNFKFHKFDNLKADVFDHEFFLNVSIIEGYLHINVF